MNVLWLHNYKDGASGMFMWDVFERLVNVPGLDLHQHALPVIRSAGEVMKTIEILRGLPEGQDITHGQYGSLIGFLSSFSKANKILSLRGSEIYPGQGPLYERLAGRIRQLLSYMAALRADSVLVMSNAMRDIVIQWPGIKRDVVHVLPDPAGAAFWPEANRYLEPLLAQTRLNIVTANIQKDNPIKRIYLIEQAVNLCRAAGLNVDFQVITGVERILRRLGADPDLIKICRRDSPLPVGAPPGASEPVSEALAS